MSTITALNVHEVPIVVYFGTLEVGFSRKEDTTDPSYERGAVLLYELGPGFHMLVIYYEEKDSHQTLRELLQRLYRASTMGPLTATTAVMTSDEKVSRVAVMLHDAKTNLDEATSVVTFTAPLGPDIYRISLRFKLEKEMWEFSQLVTERKIAITAQREQLNFLVHRAAALIPGKTGNDSVPVDAASK